MGGHLVDGGTDIVDFFPFLSIILASGLLAAGLFSNSNGFSFPNLGGNFFVDGGSGINIILKQSANGRSYQSGGKHHVVHRFTRSASEEPNRCKANINML